MGVQLLNTLRSPLVCFIKTATTSILNGNMVNVQLVRLQCPGPVITWTSRNWPQSESKIFLSRSNSSLRLKGYTRTLGRRTLLFDVKLVNSVLKSLPAHKNTPIEV